MLYCFLITSSLKLIASFLLVIHTCNNNCTSVYTYTYLTFWVHLLLLNGTIHLRLRLTTWEWIISSSSTLEKTYSSSLRSHWLPVAFNLGVGSCGIAPSAPACQAMLSWYRSYLGPHIIGVSWMQLPIFTARFWHDYSIGLNTCE